MKHYLLSIYRPDGDPAPAMCSPNTAARGEQVSHHERGVPCSSLLLEPDKRNKRQTVLRPPSA